MAARREIVVRSPRLAAIGVATLSGLIWSRRDNRITAAMAEPSNDRQTITVVTAVLPLSGRLKTRDLTSRDLTSRHHIARVESRDLFHCAS